MNYILDQLDENNFDLYCSEFSARLTREDLERLYSLLSDFILKGTEEDGDD